MIKTLCFFILISMASLSVYRSSNNPSWKEDIPKIRPPIKISTRNQGDSLEGYWYDLEEHGCFRGSTVFKISKNEIKIIDQYSSHLFADNLSYHFDDNEVIVKMRLIAGTKNPKNISIYFKDFGEYIYSFKITDSNSTANSNFLNLYRCDEPTFWGLISQSWKEKLAI